MTPKRWAVAGAAVLVVAAVAGGSVALSGPHDRSSAAKSTPVTTATVERGNLSDMVSLNGTLTHRAHPDGTPYTVVNQAAGTYTDLPENGDRVGCGDVLYRVDDQPVLLLCGSIPSYRALHTGDTGKDVRQLNRNLHALGYGTEPDTKTFTTTTARALERLQAAKGLAPTGGLGIGEAVFLPESIQISSISGKLGGSARPGTAVAQTTSDTLEVQVSLDPSQQGVVRKGDAALVTLPGNRTVKGSVDRVGRVARIPEGQDPKSGDAVIPAYIRLDDPKKASGLDLAPVRVAITTKGVDNALSVPVIALVGRTGGGFAVETVGAGGRRELVGVTLGLFDSSGGRVEVKGGVRAGDRVVVPSP